MLDQKKVFEVLKQHGVTFFTGVPDSYLNGFCNYALAHCGERNVIAANEGNAVAIAAGHYFASRELPLVYMQNSGMGNAVNPLASLADGAVYAAPMLLLIGWRGQGDSEPNHPQHKLQGEITPKLLDVMHIPYTVLTDDDAAFAAAVRTAADYCSTRRQPYGLIAPKGVMADPDKPNNVDGAYPMSREEAIEVILDHMPPDTVYAATTGRATRELYFLRERRGETKARDFLNVGAMGHASSVALGIALARPERRVVALDGDGAAIMHMGGMAIVAKHATPNYVHVVFNNGAHDSVGGQPTVGLDIDMPAVAKAVGYRKAFNVSTRGELEETLEVVRHEDGPLFIQVCVRKGNRKDLGRPTTTPIENKKAFMENLVES